MNKKVVLVTNNDDKPVFEDPDVYADRVTKYSKMNITKADLIVRLVDAELCKQGIESDIEALRGKSDHRITHLLGELSQQKFRYEKELHAKDKVIQQLRHLADARYYNSVVLRDAFDAMRHGLEVIANPENYSAGDGTCNGEFPAIHAQDVLSCISVQAVSMVADKQRKVAGGNVV